MEATAASTRRVVVTGATGFLGGAVARRLRAARPQLDVLALGRDPVRGAELQADGIAFSALDLVDAEAVSGVLRRADTVVHCAALSSPWGRPADFVAANIRASENVAGACVEHGLRRLVHISTPGIYHDGRPHRGIREDQPLPARAVNQYAASKRIAEARVRAIAGAGGPSVLVLRPRAIFGPGDTAILPRIAQALRRGRLRRIGDAQCTVDLSYIDNVVDAVLLAADAPAVLGGRSYNISNGEPVRIWEVIDRLADALALPRPKGRIPRPLALGLASLVEAGYRIAAPGREPPLLRYGVELLSVDMTLDISRARDELGYRPRIPMEEALTLTFRELALAGAPA